MPASDPCILIDDVCIASPGFPEDYRHSESCTITTLSRGIITTTEFDTQSGHTILTVAGVGYAGDKETGDGPNNIAVDSGAVISWLSDATGLAEGSWKICLSATGTPSVAPTAVIGMPHKQVLSSAHL